MLDARINCTALMHAALICNREGNWHPDLVTPHHAPPRETVFLETPTAVPKVLFQVGSMHGQLGMLLQANQGYKLTVPPSRWPVARPWHFNNLPESTFL